VCSWSLEASTVELLIERTIATGVAVVQLALDPIRLGVMPATVADGLRAHGVAPGSGMMGMTGEDYSTPASIRRTGGVMPDGTWEANLAAGRVNARIAADLGLKLVTFHAGFIPPGLNDPARAKLIGRLRTLADVFASHGVTVGLETGQEQAETLVALLRDLNHPGVGVNFDPANLILYGMGDPISALTRLAQHVVQVHIKDALPPRRAGDWGQEVPVGTGAVDWAPFFTELGAARGPLDLMIEREAGSDRVGDIAGARRFLEHLRIVA
jgi:L-ribulose-5-phosphate 3-epimerase